MSGTKLNARQKMINMMYLVLTALLALNVSREIIKSFNLMENSLDASAKNLAARNLQIQASIDSEAKENKAAKAAARHYRSVHEASQKLLNHLERVKADLLFLSNGRKKDAEGELVKGGLNELNAADNMEIHSNYFLQLKGGSNGRELKDAINRARTEMLAEMDAALSDPDLGGDANMPRTHELLAQRRQILSARATLAALDTKNAEGELQGWVTTYLENAPLAAVFAMLSKIENDARTLESEIAQALAESVGASSLKFDNVMPVIRSLNPAVLTNQQYEAEIVLAAYDSKADLAMTVDGHAVEVKNGKGIYKMARSAPGEYTYQVGIKVPQPGGGMKEVFEEGKYTVFAPMAAISADELNVIYEGLPNPLSITVAGVNPKDVRVTWAAPGGDVTLESMGNGKYHALCPVRRGSEVTINTVVKVEGREVPMGSKRFRIRRVPNPQFMVGPFDFSQPIPVSALRMQTRALAVLPNFVYEGVTYTVQRYHFICYSRSLGVKDVTVTGNGLTQLAEIFARLKPGDNIQFDQIVAIGPGGTRPIPGVAAVLK